MVLSFLHLLTVAYLHVQIPSRSITPLTSLSKYIIPPTRFNLALSTSSLQGSVEYLG